MEIAAVMMLFFFLVFSAAGCEYVWQEGAFAPPANLLAFQDGIFVMKQLKLFLHQLHMASLSLSIIFCIEFASLSRLFCTFRVGLAAGVLVVQKLIEIDEVVFWDFWESGHVFVGVGGDFVEPIDGGDVFEIEIVTHWSN